ncbi:MAG: 30S ribosomal protein S3 [Pyrinomonadaceae bacterium MAG19_C2-C3]|nr:30S ribosomal protein S3 [Pyrinomonadaceae bacterium MAG19_C2-C3]
MGQKVHPYGFRLGYNKDWHSHWFAKKQYGEFLHEDLKLKRDLKSRFAGAGVSHVDVERAANRLKIIIYTSRPGIIIGRKGAEIDKLKSDISSRTGREVLVSIQEIHRPELNAQLQAEKIAQQLEKRIAFRRAMRKTIEESLRFGAEGIKVMVGGRLNGAEIARTERYLEGRLPLHTLRADIDYGLAEAHTTFGVIGVKVWIYRGDILDPAAAMARGTGTDPINDTQSERRPKTRREREDGGGEGGGNRDRRGGRSGGGGGDNRGGGSGGGDRRPRR